MKTESFDWQGMWTENRNGEHEWFSLWMKTKHDSSGFARGLMRWKLEDTTQANRQESEGRSEVWNLTGRCHSNKLTFRLSKIDGAQYPGLVCDVDDFDFLFDVSTSGNILTYEYTNPDGWRHVASLVKVI